MPAEVKRNDSAEAFVGSVFKFSISTYINFAVYGAGLLLINFLVPDTAVSGDIQQFITSTNLVMTVGILGLDQSLIRFFHEPPGRLSQSGLFRACFYFSGAVLILAGTAAALFLRRPIAAVLGLAASGAEVVPLLFLNALFFMVARFFNVLYRMEQNIRIYTVQSVLMNFFFRLFYLLGAFFEDQFTAMMLCSVLGLGGFALVFCIWRRRLLRPEGGEFSRETLGTILPYGIFYAPTAVMVHLNSVFSLSYVSQVVSPAARGLYGYAVTLSNIVTTVQAGFASFWGAYMFQNYKTQQPRICKVHDLLNFVILSFFALLVAFQDVIFLILRNYAGAAPIFPLMMLSAVFTILCETTVYGIAIARRPVFDTLGIGLSFGMNVLLCVLLVPRFELVGAAIALAGANLAMYLFRTVIAQKFYRTIRYPLKSAAALLLAVLLGVLGTVFSGHFAAKAAVSAAALGLLCLMYRAELLRCLQLAGSILKMIFARLKAGKT